MSPTAGGLSCATGAYVIAFCVSLVIRHRRGPAASAQPRFSVLVFSKVNGYYHDSIPAGQQAITELGAEHGFDVTVSDDAASSPTPGLAPFDAVVFNNTNSRDGAILNAAQRAAFERYIQAAAATPASTPRAAPSTTGPGTASSWAPSSTSIPRSSR